MRELLSFVSLLAAALLAGRLQSPTRAAPPKQAAWHLQDLVERSQKEGRSYLGFLERDTVKTGLYRLQAGSVDNQKPHDLDEVYYIIRGRSKFTADGVQHDVIPGDILFVERQVEHRFHAIEEDLQVLVFFSTKQPE